MIANGTWIGTPQRFCVTLAASYQSSFSRKMPHRSFGVRGGEVPHAASIEVRSNSPTALPALKGHLCVIRVKGRYFTHSFRHIGYRLGAITCGSGQHLAQGSDAARRLMNAPRQIPPAHPASTLEPSPPHPGETAGKSATAAPSPCPGEYAPGAHRR